MININHIDRIQSGGESVHMQTALAKTNFQVFPSLQLWDRLRFQNKHTFLSLRTMRCKIRCILLACVIVNKMIRKPHNERRPNATGNFIYHNGSLSKQTMFSNIENCLSGLERTPLANATIRFFFSSEAKPNGVARILFVAPQVADNLGTSGRKRDFQFPTFFIHINWFSCACFFGVCKQRRYTQHMQ